jgi:hypothetical protein
MGTSREKMAADSEIYEAIFLTGFHFHFLRMIG